MYCLASYLYAAMKISSQSDEDLWLNSAAHLLGGLAAIMLRPIIEDETEYLSSSPRTRLLGHVTILIMVNNFVAHPFMSFASAFLDEMVIRIRTVRPCRSLSEAYGTVCGTLKEPA